MDFFFSKFLPLFVYPLGLAVFAGLVGGLLALRRRAFAAGILILVAFGILWVCSAPGFAAWVVEGLEEPLVPVSAEELPPADAIVVLGGMAVGRPGKEETVDYSDAVDRVLFAKRLYDARKAPLLVVSGGAAEGWTPESEIVAQLLAALGVPAAAMRLETKSRNTHQNALFVSDLLAAAGADRVLLVTSAFHMRRALASFAAVGVAATPAPTDYHQPADEFGILDWLPDAAALRTTTMMLKEYIGLVVYRLRGWA